MQKVINVLHNLFYANESTWAKECKMTKEIWDKEIHESSDNVREQKKSLVVI